MNENQRQGVAGWLYDVADKMEEDEPYATNTIASLRDAADMISAMSDGQDPEGGEMSLAV